MYRPFGFQFLLHNQSSIWIQPMRGIRHIYILAKNTTILNFYGINTKNLTVSSNINIVANNDFWSIFMRPVICYWFQNYRLSHMAIPSYFNLALIAYISWQKNVAIFP